MAAVLPVLASVFGSFIEDYRFDISLIPRNFLSDTVFSLSTYLNFFTRANPVKTHIFYSWFNFFKFLEI